MRHSRSGEQDDVIKASGWFPGNAVKNGLDREVTRNRETSWSMALVLARDGEGLPCVVWRERRRHLEELRQGST